MGRLHGQKAHEKRSCELCAWRGCEHMSHKAHMRATQLLAENIIVQQNSCKFSIYGSGIFWWVGAKKERPYSFIIPFAQGVEDAILLKSLQRRVRCMMY